LKTCRAPAFRYSFEEFTDHIKAMRTVRQWEYTSRFGHLGKVQTSRANSARVLEYFSDSYQDRKEALYKAELFLSINDYIGRHAEVFARKDLVEELAGNEFSVRLELLRAVHYAFSVSPQAADLPPKKVLALARALGRIDEAA
jgi:hypothetical protein